MSCGANLNVAPWYKEYTKTIQVGGCPTARMAATVNEGSEISAAPNPFLDQTTVMVKKGDQILSVKLYDINGTLLLNTEDIELEQITLGDQLKAGVYILNIITESGTQNKRIIKIE